jgi:hypothetical protein
MDMRVLYFNDRPHWRVAEARLREAQASVGDTAASVTYERVETPAQAEGTGFRGSPTILVDGRDPFAHPDEPVGLSCRMYRNPAGAEHSPTVEQIRSALNAAR